MGSNTVCIDFITSVIKVDEAVFIYGITGNYPNFFQLILPQKFADRFQFLSTTDWKRGKISAVYTDSNVDMEEASILEDNLEEFVRG